VTNENLRLQKTCRDPAFLACTFAWTYADKSRTFIYKFGSLSECLEKGAECRGIY